MEIPREMTVEIPLLLYTELVQDVSEWENAFNRQKNKLEETEAELERTIRELEEKQETIGGLEKELGIHEPV